MTVYVYISLLAVFLFASGGSAQIALARGIMGGRDVSNPLPASPAQGTFNIGVLETRLQSIYPSTATNYPKDSLDRLIEDRARSWFFRVSKQEIPAMQIDNLARLLTSYGKDVEAKRYFSQRLATVGLSYSDRIYTLTTGFEIFADVDRPERIPQAVQYLAQIDALGEQAFEVSFGARNKLVSVYYRLGMADSVIKYGLETMDLLARMPFRSRPFDRIPFFLELADALVPRPNSRSEIEKLGKRLMSLASPTEAMIAEDSINLVLGRQFKRSVDANINTARLLGNQVPKVIGHFWLNTAQEKGYQEKSLSDGKIRVVEIGNYQCHWCLEAIPGMKRISDRFASNSHVEMMYVTNTFGFWGVNAASPSEEVEKLKDHYINKRGLKFPIIIWAPEREATEDGDFSIPPSPNNRAFFVTGTPRFCVIDGQGRLRRVITGYTRDIEEQLVDIVEYLIAEQGR